MKRETARGVGVVLENVIISSTIVLFIGAAAKNDLCEPTAASYRTGAGVRAMISRYTAATAAAAGYQYITVSYASRRPTSDGEVSSNTIECYSWNFRPKMNVSSTS